MGANRTAPTISCNPATVIKRVGRQSLRHAGRGLSCEHDCYRERLLSFQISVQLSRGKPASPLSYWSKSGFIRTSGADEVRSGCWTLILTRIEEASDAAFEPVVADSARWAARR
jgi:hypothetical protein